MIGNFAAIVLAAGKGTRLAEGHPSPIPKVLYEIAGRPIVSYTLELLKKVGFEEIVIVVGYKAGDVKRVVGSGFKFAIQDKRLGTGHAAKIGLANVSPGKKEILIINGDDSAFYKVSTLQKILNKHVGRGDTITFVILRLENPTGLGRAIRRNGEVVDIIEEKDATSAQKKIKEINDGVYVFNRGWLEQNLPNIKKSKMGEYYLVDLIRAAVAQGKKVGTFVLEDSGEWRGVNTPEELKIADKLMRERISDASEE
jgi:bifunctional N-acetylglucosamine-1-phosphate-uridyltransferase/glucosamine-1-phosphate-acetyltransferase GlmU-like protein